ncbi:MAG: hypothetical protein BLITH_0317 [Brockia lithotrophica]|uniref:Uncharacterized protein n=1 Tax=Brockia lithotrophica TaxID=933949 RepID=A0A2T5GAM1_9BACL|nr:MAG: hypothetical protein BLITH_0317 [Brockia lithotrophica]
MHLGVHLAPSACPAVRGVLAFCSDVRAEFLHRTAAPPPLRQALPRKTHSYPILPRPRRLCLPPKKTHNAVPPAIPEDFVTYWRKRGRPAARRPHLREKSYGHFLSRISAAVNVFVPILSEVNVTSFKLPSLLKVTVPAVISFPHPSYGLVM